MTPTSFLQSQDWAEFQKSLGREVFDIAEVKIIKHDLPFGKNYLYVPYVTQMTNDEFRMTNEIAKKEKSIFVKVEPLSDGLAQALTHQGYAKSSKNIQPQKTVVIDLTRSEDELLSAMHHKTRYNIRLAERQGVVVRKCRMKNDEFRMFWDLMQKTTERDKFHSYPQDYYEKLLQLQNTSLWMAYHGDQPIAGAIILTHSSSVYYLHGASDHQYRSHMAPYLLHWNIIKSFKNSIIDSSLDIRHSSFISYDLWGISPKWPGVTRFKLGWGGRIVEYQGAFDLTISKLWYFAYCLANR